MSIGEFLQNCQGEVRIRLSDGATYTGHFRTDILGPSAMSAYFHGNERDLSLPIHLVTGIEQLTSDR
jgi:hypothetical protein